MNYYRESNLLYYCLLRVPKDEAYFVYFTFEANEGLCFYSTTDDSLKGQFRDIEVRAPIEAKENLIALLKRLQEEVRLDIIAEEIIQDS